MGFCPFTLCLSRAGLFSVIFLLRQLWLDWPNCCSTLFLAILLKYLAFPPCTCCDCLHYIVVYVLSFHIGQFYCIFCYFGPRSFSHIVHSWGIGSNPVPFVKFVIGWRFEIVALAM